MTEKFPSSEVFGLTSQMRQAAVSIPSNIAEGSRRLGANETRQFYSLAFASGAELETQIEITKSLLFGQKLDFSTIDKLLDEVMRMLNTLIKKRSA